MPHQYIEILSQLSGVILILDNKDVPDIWVEDVVKGNEEDKKLHIPRGKWRK